MGKIKNIDQQPKRRIFPEDPKHMGSTDEESDEGPVSRTIKEYGESTTIHGIPYVLQDARRPIEKLLWLAVIGFGIWIALYFSMAIYEDWQANPVETTVGTTGYDIANIEYPSITICAQGSVKEFVGNHKNIKCLLHAHTISLQQLLTPVFCTMFFFFRLCNISPIHQVPC